MIKTEIKKYFFEEIDSTNNFAKSVSSKIKCDALVVAKRQTAGRGRLGRSFYSPDGGIYMSLLIHPDDAVRDALKITALAAVAVAKTIETVLGTKTYIKWVNDIYCNGKKVCGILTEGSYNTEKKCFDYAVIGVGINLFKPENGFPDDIKDVAGYLTKTGEEALKNRIIDMFLDKFYDIYESKKDILGEYKSRSSVLGKQIEYIKDGKRFVAKAADISDDLELVVETKEGIRKLNSGEIKICVDSLKG